MYYYYLIFILKSKIKDSRIYSCTSIKTCAMHGFMSMNITLKNNASIYYDD